MSDMARREIDAVIRERLPGLFEKHPTESGVVMVARRPPWENGRDEWEPRWLHDGDLYQIKMIVEMRGFSPHKRTISDRIHALVESC